MSISIVTSSQRIILQHTIWSLNNMNTAEGHRVPRAQEPKALFDLRAYTSYVQSAAYIDNDLKFDIFDAGGPRGHFITSVPRAGRFPYVH